MAGYRVPYSRKEENEIVKYIVEKKIYERLRGRQVWQEFEATRRINRTWQSSKEHFRQKMLKRLLTDDCFDLTREEREKIHNGWTNSGSYLNTHNKKTQKGKSTFISTTQEDHGMTTSEEEDEVIEIS